MERYVIRGGQRGFDRLQVLARAWKPSTEGLLDRAGVAPGSRCLDLGCGSGDVTFDLARRVGPDGHVVGIDMDEVKVDLGRRAAQRLRLNNVELRVGNVYDVDETDAFDVVYCRFVLQHLSRPIHVLANMWRAVRPGGVIIVEDADFDGQFCEPPDEGFDFWVENYQRVLQHHGGDPHVGRKLFRYFAEVGIPSPEVTIAQRVETSGEAKALPFATVDATAESMEAAEIATGEQIRTALARLRAIADDETTMLASPRTVQLWARRV